MPYRSRRLRVLVVALSLSGAVALGGCEPLEADGAGGPVEAAAADTAATTPATGSGATDGDEADGDAAAAADHVKDQVTKARTMLGRLTVAGRAPKTGYDRTGGYGQAWADVTRTGCGTRDRILARDLADVGRRNACVVVSGTLADPYTATTITFRKADATKVQIDHVVPLALSWQLGAQQWPAGKRVAFANDSLNLLAVDGSANAAKSASGPDAWLPPNKAYRCTYVIRFTRVASAYALRVTTSMRATIGDLLDSCTRVEGSPADLDPLPESTWSYAATFARAPRATPDAPQPGAGSSGSAEPSGSDCPEKAPIKGNVPTDGGDRIYHAPGSRSYGQTIPEVCFASAAAAEKAGFRAPR